MFTVLLLVVGLLGLTSCGGDDDETSTGGTTEGTDAPANDGTTATSTAASDDVDPDAVLRFAHYLGVGNWDPHLSTGGPDIPLLGLVYDALVHVTPTGEAEPGLATSWEFDATSTSLTMALREGVTFTDGAAFDAEVAKANIDRAMNHPRSSVKSLLTSVSGVEVVDPMTIRLTLSKPNTTLPLVLGDRPGMMASPNQLAQDAITDPIGSGPFVLTDYAQGQSATWDRNDDYWDADSILLGGLEMTVMADSTTRFNALISGAVDLAQLDTSMLDQIETRGLEVVSGPDPRMFCLEVNPDVNPEFGDVNVRLALALAVDRQAIVDGLFFGHGSALDQVFPPTSPAYDEDLEGSFPYDPERARELLAEAGLQDGFSFEVAIGTDPVQGQVAEAVQAQLADIGIDMSIQRFDGFGPGQNYWIDHTVGAGLFRVTAGYAHQSTIEKLYAAGVQQNPGNVTSPVVDELLAEAFAEEDPDEVIATVQEISAELVERPLSVIPLVQEDLVFAASPDVRGLQIWFAGFPGVAGLGLAG